MSTRALIGRLVSPDTVEYVETSMDGHLKHTGIILRHFWTDPTKVDALFAEGRISSLGTVIGEHHDGTKWPVDQKDKESTIFACRDRGQAKDECAPITVSLDAFLDDTEIKQTHYRYLLRDNEWYVWRGHGIVEEKQLILVDEAIANVAVVLYLQPNPSGDDRFSPDHDGTHDIMLDMDEDNTGPVSVRDVLSFLQTTANNEWSWVLGKQFYPTLRLNSDSVIVSLRLRFDLEEDTQEETA